MKKILSIALLLIIVASALVVASTAADTTTYWSISEDCFVKARVLEDGTVPTYKQVETSDGVYEGLIVGLPTSATIGDELFEAKDGYYFLYYNAQGDEIGSDYIHLGTTDKVVVYDDNNQIVAEYGLVTYGDADGDGYFDVIDSTIAALCLNGFMNSSDSAAIYEAVKPRAGVDNQDVVAEDYQQIVNDCMKDEGDLEENLKGRKKPIDSTINFESAIYAYDGTAKGVPTAVDSNFAKLMTVSYNGSTTAPTASGIYSVGVTISDSEEYLVTPGTKNLGFVVIAPAGNSSYGFGIDNTSKTLTVNIKNNYASNSTLAAEFEKWLNSAYTLTIGGTQNPSTVASALPNRSFEVYSGQSSTLVKTGNTAVLGSYLPDDETLWTNNTASNSKTVTVSDEGASFEFTVAFQQDEVTVENLKRAYFMDCADAARGQRTDYTSTKNSDGTLNVSNDVKDVNLFVKQKNGYPTARVAVKKSSATCYDALSGTGVKGVLVGRTDSVAIQASSTPDFTGATVESLFEDSGYRYSNYSGTDMTNCIPIMNSVLSGLGIEMPTSILKLITYKVSNFIGKTGYCNYRCSGVSTGIRYNTVFYLEFNNIASSGEDASRTITTNTPTNGTITVNPANQYLHERVYEHTIMNAGEPVIVTATPASGYKLKSLTVTKSDGTLVDVASDGYFLMPASNITINAEFEAQ